MFDLSDDLQKPSTVKEKQDCIHPETRKNRQNEKKIENRHVTKSSDFPAAFPSFAALFRQNIGRRTRRVVFPEAFPVFVFHLPLPPKSRNSIRLSRFAGKFDRFSGVVFAARSESFVYNLSNKVKRNVVY